MRVDRMRTVLGMERSTDLRAGLARTLDWYLPRKAIADARV
jgi:nucleoside-diphosphate-sugar epimerase